MSARPLRRLREWAQPPFQRCSHALRSRWERWRTGRGAGDVALWVLALTLVLSGCGLGPRSTSLSQHGGLPTLRRLNWGFAGFYQAHYSPNGRWIAGLAGADYASSHLEVVSPDGQTRYDLSSWHCGVANLFDFAWLPDSRLSCMAGIDSPAQMCIGAAPFQSCQAMALPPLFGPLDDGAAWAPDGSLLLVVATTTSQVESNLVAMRPDGTIAQVFTPPDGTGYALPMWIPHTILISYITDSKLIVSTLVAGDHGLNLEAPSVLLTGQDYYDTLSRYAWSPSGHWLAVRNVNYQSGDKIYLVNRTNPAQTVDVVLATQVGQQMRDPIWSPDGKTLIVFGVNDNQPYAIDIASYLQSKGLEV